MTENRYVGRKPSKIAGAPARAAHRRRGSMKLPRLTDGKSIRFVVKRAKAE